MKDLTLNPLRTPHGRALSHLRLILHHFFPVRLFPAGLFPVELGFSPCLEAVPRLGQLGRSPLSLIRKRSLRSVDSTKQSRFTESRTSLILSSLTLSFGAKRSSLLARVPQSRCFPLSASPHQQSP